MGKRASTGQSSARPAKVPKVEDDHAPVFQLLAGERGLPGHCRDMLRAAVPHAMSTVPGERHAYQNQMIGVVNGMCSSRETKHRGAVDSARVEITAVTEGSRQAASDLDSAKIRAATKAEAKADRAKFVSECESCIATAKLALEGENEKEKAHRVEKEAVVAQKTEYEEVLTNVWQALKNSTFDGNWRQKDKANIRVIGMIEKIGCPSSLMSALAVALKQKVAARANFGKKAIDFAESVLTDHVAQLTSNIDGLEAKCAEVHTSVTTAESALKVADQKLQAAQNASIAAENEWCEEESAAVLAKNAVDNLATESDDAATVLAETEFVLAAFLQLKCKVEALRDHRIQVPEEDEPAQDESPKVEEEDLIAVSEPAAEPSEVV